MGLYIKGMDMPKESILMTVCNGSSYVIDEGKSYEVFEVKMPHGRLIDADALEKAIYEWMPKDQETWMESNIPPIENLVVSIMMTIQEQPTIYVLPPAEKTGKWVMNERGVYECSVCGRVPTEEQKQYDQYCPNCGAIMIE